MSEDITMVMVTHDVSLKSFADRVVWMRDGKIQRIEVVPKQKKEDAIRKVTEELEDIKMKKQNKVFQVRTEVRKPTDYATHPIHIVSQLLRHSSIDITVKHYGWLMTDELARHIEGF